MFRDGPPEIGAPLESVGGLSENTSTADKTRGKTSVIISDGVPGLPALFIQQGRVHLPDNATFEELDDGSCMVSVVEKERGQLKRTLEQQLSSAYDVSEVRSKAA